jgi:hypothetical protein
METLEQMKVAISTQIPSLGVEEHMWNDVSAFEHRSLLWQCHICQSGNTCVVMKAFLLPPYPMLFLYEISLRNWFAYYSSCSWRETLRVLKRSRPTKNEAIGGWRKLHNEELHYVHSSQNITRTTISGGWDGQSIEHAQNLSVYKGLIRKSRGKKITRNT